MRNFQINEMMGFWYVIQYYASSEELSEYSCMQGIFSVTDKMQVSKCFMNYGWSNFLKSENKWKFTFWEIWFWIAIYGIDLERKTARSELGLGINWVWGSMKQ